MTFAASTRSSRRRVCRLELLARDSVNPAARSWLDRETDRPRGRPPCVRWGAGFPQQKRCVDWCGRAALIRDQHAPQPERRETLPAQRLARPRGPIRVATNAHFGRRSAPWVGVSQCRTRRSRSFREISRHPRRERPARHGQDPADGGGPPPKPSQRVTFAHEGSEEPIARLP